jgi:hypothetical protein
VDLELEMLRKTRKLRDARAHLAQDWYTLRGMLGEGYRSEQSRKRKLPNLDSPTNRRGSILKAKLMKILSID